MSEKKLSENEVEEILSDLDTDYLGDLMVELADNLLCSFSGDNIVIFNISLEDLQKGNFDDIEELGSVQHGDWDTLSNLVSKSEVEQLKVFVEENYENKKEMVEMENPEDIITPDEVFSAFLYCNGAFVWGGSA